MDSNSAGRLLTLLIIPLIWNVVVCAILYNCMQRIPIRHRKIKPGRIWFLLIPIANLIWAFFVFPAVSKSFKSYFTERNLPDIDDAYTEGMVYCILNVVTGPMAGCSPIAFIPAILCLVKLVNLRDRVGPDEPLAEQQPGQ